MNKTIVSQQKTTTITMVVSRMFADIHTHILPFMDDGAESYEEALEIFNELDFDEIEQILLYFHLLLQQITVALPPLS